MNTYFIPTTAPYAYEPYEPYDYIYAVYANTSQEAYNIAKNKLFGYCMPQWSQEYECYPIKIFNIPNGIFHKSKKYDILYSLLLETKGYEHMAYFKVNWNDYTSQLIKIAAPEVWSNDAYPNNGILANYLNFTYEKLTSEKNIVIGKDYALFNTGLFTKYYEPIYAYQSGKTITFLTDYELGNIDIAERPERANYFEKPELLLFDWHYPINIQYSHILDDEKNRKRIPEEILNRKDIINTLSGSIDTMKKRVSANYKLAIPQYFEGKIQLLLPLCLKSDNIPDVALTVTRKDGYYQGHTCLTLDMAYNNARLIAKPENNWLSN